MRIVEPGCLARWCECDRNTAEAQNSRLSCKMCSTDRRWIFSTCQPVKDFRWRTSWWLKRGNKQTTDSRGQFIRCSPETSSTLKCHSAVFLQFDFSQQISWGDSNQQHVSPDFLSDARSSLAPPEDVNL